MKTVILILVYIFFIKNLNSQSAWIHTTVGNNNLVFIQFPGLNNTGYIISDFEYIYKTTNKGITWISQNTGSTVLRTGFFSNFNLGAVWGIYPKLTTNGGNTWDTMSIILNAIGQSYTMGISFLNITTGYVVGGDYYPLPNPCCNDAVIYKSTNAGLNWIEIYRHFGSDPQEIFVLDQNKIMVLDHVSFISTTNGGVNWTYNDDVFFDVRPFFSRSMTNPFKDTIYIAGIKSGFGADTGAVIKSTNNGQSWSLSLKLPFSSRFRKIFFVDNNYGYIVGDTGLIVKTSNGGDNWIVLNSGTTKKLTGVSFINRDTGFVVGDSGLVLTTYNGGLVSVENNNEIIPDNYILYQNYPNPFNPSTIINYELGITNFVSLKVYDVLGNEVTTVVNQKQNAGSYNIEFDGSNFASGIYYYKFSAGDFTETKRMVLLK